MPAPAPPHIARRLAAAIEPFVGQVYFSPECHAAYAALGFNPSPGDASGVALPDGAAYFTSRGSVMGQVHGTVVAAAFGVFNPAAVVPAVTYGWTLTDATTICTARTDGALAQLHRILGDEPDGLHRAVQLLLTAVEPLRPEGKPLFAGLSALPMPEPPLGVAWRLGDMLREYRGDAHIAAWTGAGFDPPEIGLLTERYWGLPAAVLRPHPGVVERRPRRGQRAPAAPRAPRGRRCADRGGLGRARGGRGADRPDVPASHGRARRATPTS